MNGREIAEVEDGGAFANELRKNRRLGKISGEINVAYFKKLSEVHVNADKGRVRKPYIIVENGKSKFTNEVKAELANSKEDFNMLTRRGIIEYLDAEEEENAYVTFKEEDISEKTTHLEIDPAHLLGLTVNITVFPEYNLMGRHPQLSNFAKQAQGLYATNFKYRYDSEAYILFYPQNPIISSIAYRTLNLKDHASGQNFVVALSTYYGYNMKDAIVLNKSAVDRGLGRSAYFNIYRSEEQRYAGGQQDHFVMPAPTTENYKGEHAYAKLGEDGVIEPEMRVGEGDVLIGKVSPQRFLEEETSFGIGIERTRDNSTTMRPGFDGVVDNVLVTETAGATTRLVKVRVRSIKVPEAGDKFGSRHSQKGVVALLVNQEDMPFTKQGIVPDLVLNPIGLPVRMTFGHMIETLGAKAASLDGTNIDGTPFSKHGKELVDEYGKILEKHGFDRFGDEILYDGRTGKRFGATIFTGVVYYQRLKHMVSLKQQVRSRGGVHMLTRQPTEGKVHGGGLRLGEMERDALVGYGASLLIKERMLDQSDKDTIWICKSCGDMGYYDHIKRTPVCPSCNGHDLAEVEISYAFKLLMNELKSMHMVAKFKLKGE